MEEKNYLKDISEIKQLMNRSSRFISLSGLSGILAGIYAIIGAVIAYDYLYHYPGILSMMSPNFTAILIILVVVAMLSITTAVILTSRRAKINDEKIWDTTTKRLLINFLIPLTTGGIFIFFDHQNGQFYGLTASLMLIFYGLALINASKYTLGNVKYLGYAQILIGLICAAVPGYGFWFWVLGFGVFHIIYGSLMYIQEKQRESWE
ncbi:MAG: hypothetical protein WDZ45_01080 [Flavobacteriaceae bacterium]